MIKQGRYYGTGKRKTAIARVYLQAGSGAISVNGKSVDDYFSRGVCRMMVKQPLDMLHLMAKYDVVAKVRGGGDSSQAGAIRLGIARALVACDAAEPIILDPEVLAAEASGLIEASTEGEQAVNELASSAEKAETAASQEIAAQVVVERSIVHKKLRKAG